MATSRVQQESLLVVNSTSWRSCTYCPNYVFKTSAEFTRHLRDNHCSREGGSFVCHYGYNGVCSSLPVEGVSDKDYEDHVLKHHTNVQESKDLSLMKRLSPTPLQGHLYRLSLLSDGAAWNSNAACQNMAAILNDPKRGKQKDFFTRTWGESFVEHTEIPPHRLIPEVSPSYFISYLKRISKRHKKPGKKQSLFPNNDVSHQFPILQAAKSLEKNEADLESIPKIFLQSNFSLSNNETFFKVFPFIEESGMSHVLKCGKLLQEKLSYYLDLIEMQIAHQIAHKSDPFFQAVASHDTVREELGKALTAVQAMRFKVKQVDAMLVTGALKVLHCKVSRQNHAVVYRKLKLMATVHQTQPTIQLLLSTSDFVGALDLISTTQEVVQQELVNIHCFRYLGSQLSEMENLIEKMLLTEFERHTTAELNRPLDGQTLIMEEDRLSAILFGMLRQRRFNFIVLFKDEALTTLKAVMKQTMVEALAANDADVGRGVLYEQAKLLSFASWTKLMQRCMNNLISILHRIRAINDIMVNVVTMATSRQEDVIVPEEDKQKLLQSLTEMLQSLCDGAHELCGFLLSARTKDPTFMERVSSPEFVALAQLIEHFGTDCETITGYRSRNLRLAFQSNATRFVQKFHEERRSKLGAVLDSERWRQGEVTSEVRIAVHRLLTAQFRSHDYSNGVECPDWNSGGSKDAVVVDGEAYVVVDAALFFVPQMLEYCCCVEDLPTASPDLLTRLVELLKTFNSRTCQLVLGAGALPLVGLKTITSRNLALASRSLQLVSRFIPLLKSHFEGKLSAKQKPMVKHFDQAIKDYRDHVIEIENKLVLVMSELMENILTSWEIRPPVPSTAFRSICKQIAKLHEALAAVWPQNQIVQLYNKLNVSFKGILKKQIDKFGVQNDGGPQHGTITTELVFYVQNLKSLKVLDDSETIEEFSRDLWKRR